MQQRFSKMYSQQCGPRDAGCQSEKFGAILPKLDDMAIDYLDAKNQIYIPAALIVVGCGLTKPEWIIYAIVLAAGLVWAKLSQHSFCHD